MIGGWINVDKKDLMTSSTLRITDCGQTFEDLGKIKTLNRVHIFQFQNIMIFFILRVGLSLISIKRNR